MARSIPETYDERVLSYLKDHEDYLEFDLKGPSLVEEDYRAQMAFIMKELLIKLNRRIACKDRYDNLHQWHNQFSLFDMENFIPDFSLDEEIIQKLSFRETLLISELDTDHDDSRESIPNPVGALCLNIQAIHSVLPEGLKRSCTDQELELEVLQTLQRAKQMAGPLTKRLSKDPKPHMNMEEIELELQKKVTEFENVLKAEMFENAIKFVVHLSSQFTAGFSGGSRITAWVDRRLHTLEEKRTEFVDSHNGLEEKSLYIALQSRKYYLRHASSKEDYEEKKYYSLAKTRNMLCEGANFILMRYLAFTKFVGKFELSTMYINGSMCRNIYECTGPTTGTVNNQRVEICKIYRCIIEECGIEHNSCTVLTTHGRIVTQEWDGCRIIVNMNPLQHIRPGTPSSYDRLCLDQTWYDDMELFSKYLDSKTEAELKMKTFISDHPEVKDILADYLNNILLLKPQNILSFTINFFQSLCPMKLSKLGAANVAYAPF